jgi:hypothetical protein
MATPAWALPLEGSAHDQATGPMTTLESAVETVHAYVLPMQVVAVHA